MRYRLISFVYLLLLALTHINAQAVTLEECLQVDESEADGDMQELLARAEEAFRDDEDFDSSQLCRAIRLYERVLELEPQNNRAMNRLSQAYFMLGIEFLAAQEERREAFKRGRDLGLKRLGVEQPEDPELLCAVALPAIETVTLEEGLEEEELSIAGLFWAGNNWGKWLDNLPEGERISRGFSDLRCVRASFERTLELDEEFFAAGPHRALGSLLTQIPGESLRVARAHFERAIEIAPYYLENKTNYACGYAVRVRDRALFDRLIEEVLAAPVGERYIFWNKRAKRFAEELKEQADELFAKGECKL
jgi:tetratricopeptide (TPR) repeat protein